MRKRKLTSNKSQSISKSNKANTTMGQITLSSATSKITLPIEDQSTFDLLRTKLELGVSIEDIYKDEEIVSFEGEQDVLEFMSYDNGVENIVVNLIDTAGKLVWSNKAKEETAEVVEAVVTETVVVEKIEEIVEPAKAVEETTETTNVELEDSKPAEEAAIVETVEEETEGIEPELVGDAPADTEAVATTVESTITDAVDTGHADVESTNVKPTKVEPVTIEKSTSKEIYLDNFKLEILLEADETRNLPIGSGILSELVDNEWEEKKTYNYPEFTAIDTKFKVNVKEPKLNWFEKLFKVKKEATKSYTITICSAGITIIHIASITSVRAIAEEEYEKFENSLHFDTLKVLGGLTAYGVQKSVALAQIDEAVKQHGC